MSVSVEPDGAIRIVAARTPLRRAIALLMLVVPVVTILMYSTVLVLGEVWTWPLTQVFIVVVFGFLLNPQVWTSLLFVVGFQLHWSGETVLFRQEKYIVAKRLVWGKGYPHKIDVERLPSIDLKVVDYPRDTDRTDWTTAFRPRVVGTSRDSRILSVGEGLSLAEADLLVEALANLVGPKAHVLSNPGFEQKARPAKAVD